MIFIERYPLKRCQGCVKLIASKVNCFLNINDLSEVQLCMSSHSGTWECPHTKVGADHVPFLSSVFIVPLLLWRNHGGSGVQPPPLMGLPIIFFLLKENTNKFQYHPHPHFSARIYGTGSPPLRKNVSGSTPTPNGAPYYILLFTKNANKFQYHPPPPLFDAVLRHWFPSITQKKVSGFWSPRASLFGILLSFALNDFFHINWVWTFAWFVRPLLATIFCIMANLVPAYT